MDEKKNAQQGNLYIIDLATGKEHALTQDGAGPISFGMADFAALCLGAITVPIYTTLSAEQKTPDHQEFFCRDR